MKILGGFLLLVSCLQHTNGFCPCRVNTLTSLRKDNAMLLRIDTSKRHFALRNLILKFALLEHLEQECLTFNMTKINPFLKYL